MSSSRAASYRLARIVFSFGVFGLFVAIIYPFLIPLALGGLFAVLFYPFQKKLERRLKVSVAAGILTLAITALILIPAGLTIYSGTNFALDQLAQVGNFKTAIVKLARSPILSDAIRRAETLVGRDLGTAVSAIQELAVGAAVRFADWLSTLASAVPGFLMNVAIMVVALFFFLLDGRKLIAFIRGNSFFGPKETDQLLRVSGQMCRSVVLATVVAGLAQTLVFLVALLASHTPNWALLSLLVFLMSFIPLIGSAPVTFGCAIYQAIMGDWVAFGILLVGIGIVGAIDNVVRPLILKGAANLHPLLAFIGAFGGIQILGVSGIFLGPIIMGIFIVTLEILVAPEPGG